VALLKKNGDLGFLDYYQLRRLFKLASLGKRSGELVFVDLSLVL